MRNYTLSLPGHLSCRFQTACDLNEGGDAFRYMRAHLPGVTIQEGGAHVAEPDFSIIHNFADKTKLTCSGSKVVFLTPQADEFTRDICHLIYAATRKILIKAGYYPVHASCVGGDEQGYRLLVGHSGAGKSSLAHHLVEDYGFKLFSGNKTVIQFEEESNITAIAGTQTMTVLGDDLKRVSYVMNEEHYASSQQVPITSIHLIRLHEGAEETQQQAKSTSIRSLYPYFMDAVNADIIVGDYHVFNGAVPSKSKHHLNRNLRQSLKQVPVYRHAGSLDYLADKVLSL
jgi:hypothetical protein